MIPGLPQWQSYGLALALGLTAVVLGVLLLRMRRRRPLDPRLPEQRRLICQSALRLIDLAAVGSRLLHEDVARFRQDLEQAEWAVAGDAAFLEILNSLAEAADRLQDLQQRKLDATLSESERQTLQAEEAEIQDWIARQRLELVGRLESNRIR